MFSCQCRRREIAPLLKEREAEIAIIEEEDACNSDIVAFGHIGIDRSHCLFPVWKISGPLVIVWHRKSKNHCLRLIVGPFSNMGGVRAAEDGSDSQKITLYI